MSEERAWLHRISDMLERIEKISSYVDGLDYKRFMENSMLIEAIERNIEIIGEAADAVPQDIRDKNPSIPWRSIVGMRNRLIHDYGGTNVETLWNVATEEIHDLKAVLSALYEIHGESEAKR